MKIRNTKQKQVVEQVMQKAARPLTINEILIEGQKLLSTLGVSTVYREINRLLETHELQTVSIPNDPIRYELAKHHHHHFKCTDCDKVYEIEGCSTDLKKMVPKGFKPKTHDLTFYGLCPVCG